MSSNSDAENDADNEQQMSDADDALSEDYYSVLNIGHDVIYSLTTKKNNFFIKLNSKENFL
jgi:hypothetical protein